MADIRVDVLLADVPVFLEIYIQWPDLGESDLTWLVWSNPGSITELLVHSFKNFNQFNSLIFITLPS